ncbi:hypothetical protein PAPHI01_2572 [Pancytospora philotis]|nr:hypothetical protein PAPHI01_2572 [Pancytospora philotis]
MRKMVHEVLSRCEICSKNNRKHGGGAEFIHTEHRMEKTAIDILKIDGPRPYILVFIDFYTRILRLHSLRARTSSEIITTLNAWWEDLGIPKQLNTDNALEFVGKHFEDYCRDLRIQHHRTSIEKHEANGRVERAIRTVRDGLVKTKGQGHITRRLAMIQDAYNRSLHSAIGMSPNEAWADTGDTLRDANAADGAYAQRFKPLKREKFEIGQPVRIAKTENLKTRGKSHDRFQDTGTITDYAGKDSYMVRDSTGRIIKRSHAHLKGFEQA